MLVSGVSTVFVSVVTVDVSVVVVSSPPPLLQATNAPTARTNKSFFIVFFLFGY